MLINTGLNKVSKRIYINILKDLDLRLIDLALKDAYSYSVKNRKYVERGYRRAITKEQEKVVNILQKNLKKGE
jgi:hypothetical protein